MKKFTKTHEWIQVENSVGTIGITEYAQEKLGDVVYADLPEAGKTVKKGEILLSLESVKAASDVYAPVSGKVVEVNTALEDKPEIVNKDAEGEGWLVKIEIIDPAELEDLLDEEDYKKLCEEEG
ncbi:MAG: glycine cleavage system protein GcvH [Thermotogaceae bacterium]|nr:glycine cleavage system protein GcvH [Thermotogaceae bacterium]